VPHVERDLANELVEMVAQGARAVDRGAHYQALQQFARDLGSVEEMESVFNEAVERFGYPAVVGVNSAWNGIYGWMD
jgi:hypothetical protein